MMRRRGNVALLFVLQTGAGKFKIEIMIRNATLKIVDLNVW